MSISRNVHCLVAWLIMVGATAGCGVQQSMGAMPTVFEPGAHGCGDFEFYLKSNSGTAALVIAGSRVGLGLTTKGTTVNMRKEGGLTIGIYEMNGPIRSCTDVFSARDDTVRETWVASDGRATLTLLGQVRDANSVYRMRVDLNGIVMKNLKTRASQILPDTEIPEVLVGISFRQPPPPLNR